MHFLVARILVKYTEELNRIECFGPCLWNWGGHCVYILSRAIEKVQLLKGKSNFVKRCLMLSTVAFQSDTGRGLGTTSLQVTLVLSKCPEKNSKDKDKGR